MLSNLLYDDICQSLRQSTFFFKWYTIHFLAYSSKAFFSTFECVKKVDTYIRKKSRKIIKYDLIYSKALFSKKS
jgi:hypothetical protein